MLLVYIHGANATGESFNYIRENLKYSNEYIIEYNSREGFDNNLESMYQAIKSFDKMFFVCHSLGGIYAVNLADRLKSKVIGAITISTPYGGSEHADYVKYFLPFNQLFRDIGPSSKTIKTTNNIKINHPWCNIITTNGDSPWIIEPNDGVVTVASQRYRTDMEFEELSVNHYEVILSPHTVKIIKDRIKQISK